MASYYRDYRFGSTRCCPLCACSAVAVSLPVTHTRPVRMRGYGAYIDLLVGPAVHTQRLDFGDVRAKLSVDGGAPHAKKDAELHEPWLADSSGTPATVRVTGRKRRGLEATTRDNVHSMMPMLQAQRVSQNYRLWCEAKRGAKDATNLGWGRGSRRIGYSRERCVPAPGAAFRCAPAGACSTLRTWQRRRVVGAAVGVEVVASVEARDVGRPLSDELGFRDGGDRPLGSGRAAERLCKDHVGNAGRYEREKRAD